MSHGTQVRSPGDLRALSVEGLQQLAEDLRHTIIATCLKNGGHIGASLGTVELTIALHAVFESPREALVWDVGHQAYAHKLLTGRWERFGTLRKSGGISGFLSREESEHDVFGAGHSSTSLSAALAIAWAKEHQGKPDWTVAVIGDGGMTAGLAFEALNNARGLALAPFLVVLNDNQMSISPNVGAMTSIFSGSQVRDFFELLGFDYEGPVDGHDLRALIQEMNRIRGERPERPIVLHVMTQKGKGYAPAEESPASFHGIGPMKEKIPEQPVIAPELSYSEVFGQELCRLAESDPRVVAVTAAMADGTGLVEFARRFPDRFFDVGIAEPHAAVFAAGLATQGIKPVVAIYSTFLQRALDELIHDIALQKLGVVLAVDRAGLVGADGPTHHGAFDIAYLSMIPNMKLAAPACQKDLRELLARAVGEPGPVAIRYPRGSGAKELAEAPDAEGVRSREAGKKARITVVVAGHLTEAVFRAAAKADGKGEGISVYATQWIKPIPAGLVRRLDLKPESTLLTVEAGVIRGGFGEALAAELATRTGPVEHLGYPDEFIPHGSPAELDEKVGLSEAALVRRFQELLKKP